MTPAVDHLAQLIRIPSVSTLSNRPLIDYTTTVFHTAGWTTRVLSYADRHGIEKVNLIAAPPGQSVDQRGVDLALLCHTDTVPYASDWPAALSPVRDGNLLRGCGACDVKGFLACLLAAAQSTTAYIDGLRIVLSADEEIGCLGSKHLLAADALRPTRVVIGEPTSLHVARAGKGYSLAQIVLHGREAHSAHPEQGLSSIYAAARLIAAIEQLAAELAAETHSLFQPPCTTLNIGTIAGGSAKNIIPGRTELLLEWRPIPGQPATRIPAAVEAALDRLRDSIPGLRTECTVLRQQPGFETSAESPLVRAIEHATARSATSIAFGSEAPFWPQVAEEVVVFGPGDMRTAHSSRECVPIDELEQATAAVLHLMTHG